MKILKILSLFVLLLSFSSPASAQFVKDIPKIQTSLKNERAKIFLQLVARTKKPQIIDIRTPQEYAQGHLKGAILINYYDRNFTKNIEKAGLNKLKPIYIYCQSGHRSANAIGIFKKLGFKHIVNLIYGINEWKHLLLPLEK